MCVKSDPVNRSAQPQPASGTVELLVLPEGQILAHNLTPELAALLARLNPADEAMARRAAAACQVEQEPESSANRPSFVVQALACRERPDSLKAGLQTGGRSLQVKD
jgi:hypothetical protein